MTRHQRNEDRDEGNTAIFSRYARKLLLLIPTLISVGYNITTLFGLEVALAKKSAVKIIVLSMIATCLFLSAWLSFLVLLFFYLLSWQISAVVSVFIIFVTNLVAFGVVTYFIIKLKKHLFFPAIRHQLIKVKRKLY